MDENNQEVKHVLPLGVCRQAAMKLDAFMSDLYEIKDEEGLDQETKDGFDKLIQMSNYMLASLVNLVKSEIGEEDFLSEDIAMDEILTWDDEDLLQQTIDLEEDESSTM